MSNDFTRLSKTIAHALRHAPEEYALRLDDAGWVSTQALLAALRQRHPQWRELREADLAAMIAQAEKQRYEMRDGRIRAFYGHSIAEQVRRAAAPPPATLYHGTTPWSAEKIHREGLRAMMRQYVHLSAERETAQQVARRRTDHPVLLLIAAHAAHEQGIRFYPGNQMVWLAEPIPPRFITEE